jgi:hypothetical protein
METDENLQKCWSILDKLKPGEIMELKRIDENRKHIFIACTKQYIDCFHNVEFNNDYSKLKKI